ncbi:glycoside hydrolase family 128 protein [Xylona heveae TC161]|uniref:Glycoside hydrolase family 128 protein n=1 Tax=Xylona heveae (strain CBS 132557 / TC161) TaxID=1328760 RepID=A0A165A8M5_XYLHT|nr:glycoside hydrolase family 128 protein [Xylona heveae TC161]KZF20099.1 glycoside hydrolase family 128 protein [Xylona heveae TC161]
MASNPVNHVEHANEASPANAADKQVNVHKRCLLWDWTNTQNCPWAMDKVNFHGPIHSCSNWNTWVPPELKGRLPFRPMVRTTGQLGGQDWENIEKTTEHIIHFFNEPERAGVSPEQAADAWVKQMLPLRQQKGKKLVSPSCADDGAGRAWIEDFMNRVQAHPPDYLGLHYYGTNGDDAIKYIEEMHHKHPHQPIIVSEIASISRNKNEVYHFTAQLANWMDKTPWVFEYGFFGCMEHVADNFVSPQAQLMNPNGSFTELMLKLMNDEPIKP